jgi:hypothetical protein
MSPLYWRNLTEIIPVRKHVTIERRGVTGYWRVVNSRSGNFPRYVYPTPICLNIERA